MSASKESTLKYKLQKDYTHCTQSKQELYMLVYVFQGQLLLV